MQHNDHADRVLSWLISRLSLTRYPLVRCVLALSLTFSLVFSWWNVTAYANSPVNKTEQSLFNAPQAAPVFSSQPMTQATSDQSYTYLIQASDADGDGLTFTVPVSPSWLSLSHDPVTYVSTTVGSTSGYADGTGSGAQFNEPGGIAIDSSGNIYIADTQNHRIRKVTPAGVVSTLAGTDTAGYVDGTGTAAQFEEPRGIVVDSAGNLYVADSKNHSIRKITSAGIVTTFAGTDTNGFADSHGTAARFNQPSGLAIDSSDNLYVADTLNHRIREVTSVGVVSTIAGTGTLGYIDDTGTAARFDHPYGLELDSNGHIYVADTESARIRKIIMPSRVVTTTAGSVPPGFHDGAANGSKFNKPFDVAIDAAGNLYVADYNNNRIRKITPSGDSWDVSTIAGGSAGFANGFGPQAQLNKPSALAFDAQGTLYVADTNNHRVRSVIFAQAMLTGTPSRADGGTDNVTLRVTDGTSNVDQSFTIAVDVPNTAPTITGTVPTNVMSGTAYSFTPLAQDAENDALTFTITNKPTWATFSTSTGQISGVPTATGTTSNIVIMVTDVAGASASLGPFSLTVKLSNTAPTISNALPTTIMEDSLLSYTPTANDADGDPLAFSISSTDPLTWATFDLATGHLSGTPTNSEVGVYRNIIISVTDGTQMVSLAPVTMTVANTNDAPTITGTTPFTQVYAESSYTFTPTSNDIDVGDVLTFTITNKPSWATFDTKTGNLSGIAADSDVGTYNNIIISVTDGTSTAVLPAFNLEIIQSPITTKHIYFNGFEDGPNPTSELRIEQTYSRTGFGSRYTPDGWSFRWYRAVWSGSWTVYKLSASMWTLRAGEYTGTVNITVDNQPFVIPATLTIRATGELDVVPTKLAMGTTQNNQPPLDQRQFKVQSTGSLTVPWTASSDQSWLTLTPTTGTSPSTVTMSISDTILATAGVYTAHMTITNSNDTSQNVHMTATLNVVAENNENVELSGLEVTQGVQDLLGSVSLVQDRPTFVRAHVRSRTGQTIQNVTGQLIGTRNGVALPHSPLEPINKGGSINVLDAPSRLQINDSFLFELPASWRNGNVTLEFKGISEPVACRESTGVANDCLASANFSEVLPDFPLRVGPIIWTHNGVTRTPTQANLESVAKTIYASFPMGKLDLTYERIPLIYYEQLNMDNLGMALSHYRVYIQNKHGFERALHYGVANGVGGGMAYMPGNTSAGVTAPGVVAHEVGHNFSYGHNHKPLHPYPNGEPAQSGDRASYHFNIYSQRVYPPGGDVMTNWPRMVSPWQHNDVINRIRQRYSTANRAPAKVLLQANQDGLLVTGVLTPSQSSGQLGTIIDTQSQSAISTPDAGDYTLRLLDSSGTQLASHSFGPTILPDESGDLTSDATSSQFELMVPRVNNLNRVELLLNNNVIASRVASANPPTVTVTAPNGGETFANGSTVNATWTSSDADGDSLVYVVEYSVDGGTTWSTLAANDSNSASLEVDSLPGSTQALIRVWANDGFNTSVDQSDANFTVNTKAPEVAILNPTAEENTLFVGEQLINFEGTALDKEDGTLTNTLTWHSDKHESSLGSGTSLAVTADQLEVGQHVITLMVTDSHNMTGTATTNIEIYRDRPVLSPTIDASPANLGFIVEQNSAQVHTTTLAIRNSGDGTLNWVATSSFQRVRVSTSSGTAPSDITIEADAGSLAAGIYTGTVEIQSPDAVSTTLEIPFTLQVVVPPTPTPTNTPVPPSGPAATPIPTITPTPTATPTSTPIPDDDSDGASDAVEDAAPNNGDGNGDGIKDSEQANVASLPNTGGSDYITLVSPSGSNLVDVNVIDPSTMNVPDNVGFAQGIFDFDVNQLSTGQAFSVTLILHADSTPASGYWKYGPTSDNQSNHWYEFTYDGTTGAEINDNIVTLHFVDGQRGDADLTANGQISDPGAPGVEYDTTSVEVSDFQSEEPLATSDPLEQQWVEWLLLLLIGLLLITGATRTFSLVRSRAKREER